MKQRVSLQLITAPPEQQRLLHLQRTFNAACQYVATEAQQAAVQEVFALQGLTIGPLLERFQLPMSLAQRAVLSVAQALAHASSIPPTFPPEAAIPLDEHLVRFIGMTRLSIVTLKERLTVPFFVQRAEHTGNSRPGQVTLHCDGERCCLTVVLEVLELENPVVGDPDPVV